MTEMVDRAAIAIAKADNIDTKRVALANYTKHARAALPAALDLTPTERDAIAEALRGAEVRTGGFAFYQDTVDAVLVALKERAQGEKRT